MEAKDFETKFKPTWCPGCGNYGIWQALKNALVKLAIPQEEIAVVYGIGCHGNMSNFLNVYSFEGLHGRAVPVAIGIKTANHKLKVIVIAGDGDMYGEGINHLISAARGNHDITVIVHNNEIYGLTTGQASPTTEKGTKTKSTPLGVIEEPINALATAIVSGASFVSRGFAGDMDGIRDLICAGVENNGLSLVEVLQPCLTFEKIHNFEFLREKIHQVEESSSKKEAIKKTFEWDEKIPVGIFYKEQKPSFTDLLPQLKNSALVDKDLNSVKLDELLKDLG
jgi:2-oxoglutarate ferredoxin oxidoreductase subunit beta